MKKCRECDECKRVYRQSRCIFWRDKLYYCCVKEELVQRNSFCGNWRKKETCYDFSLQRFDEVEKDIEFLLEYFKDK